MTPRELTAEQLDQLIRTAERQLAYYCKAWRRVQAIGMPLNDPFALAICHVWEALDRWRAHLEQMKRERQPAGYHTSEALPPAHEVTMGAQPTPEEVERWKAQFAARHGPRRKR
jgi:hypothetical protein